MGEKAPLKGHAAILVNLLKEEGFRKFAEIGVWKGSLCIRVLENINLDEYWAVDPWEVMKEEATRIQRRREKWQWDGYHKRVCSWMLRFPNLRVLRTTSELASRIFPNEHLDMVYIDAIHTFKRVDEDIRFWLPKVRKGGILGGHDYGGRRRGVEQAVTKWFGSDIEVVETKVWLKRV